MMYRIAILALAFLASGQSATPVAAQGAAPEIRRAEFQPVTPWNIDYAQDSCALVRRFSDGERQVWFELRGIAPVATARMMIGTDRIGTTEEQPHVSIFPGREAFDLRARFFEGEGEVAHALVSTVSLSAFRTAAPVLPAPNTPLESIDADPVAERPAVDGIQIAEAFDETMVLWTGEMEAALDALDTCMADLVSTWGIEPAELENTETIPVPIDMERWVRRIQQHYPRSGLHRSRNTSFSVVVLVDPEGRVVRCNSPNALGDEDFLQVACASMMEYARFEPARAADGSAIHGFWSQGITYFVN